MDKKIKVLVLSDHPLSPSGVANQTKYFIEGLLKTGKFSFVCLGGAMKHKDYRPIKVEPPKDETRWVAEDWTIFPVDDYGNPDIIRSVLRTQRPDILWFMTDPRFFVWLWEMEDEIRPLIPMVYYHVWDNYPYPTYNEPFYASNDHIVTISKVTDDIVKTVAPRVPRTYLTHAVDMDVFKPLEKSVVEEAKKQFFGPRANSFLVFWNGRNARRKLSGSLIFWFKAFLDKIGKDKATLLMHTDVKDLNGQDLEAIIHHLGLTNGEVVFSQDKIDPQQMALVNNMADVAINVSEAEGHGVPISEALACGKPVIVTKTGGLQSQVYDDDGNELGVCMEPVSRAVVGSQPIPFIYEDRVSEQQVVDALSKMYNMTSEERELLGVKAREHAMKYLSLTDYVKNWDKLMTDIYEACGSWENRKNYSAWHFTKI